MAERKETRKIERERDCVAKNHTNMVTSMVKEGIEKDVHATLTSIGTEVVPESLLFAATFAARRQRAKEQTHCFHASSFPIFTCRSA